MHVKIRIRVLKRLASPVALYSPGVKISNIIFMAGYWTF